MEKKTTTKKSTRKPEGHKTKARTTKKGASRPAPGKEKRVSYLTVDGKRVPSVTTIIGKFRNSEALLYWAWEQGKFGNYYRQTRDTAATVGSVVHKYAEFAATNRFVLPNIQTICREEKILAEDARKVHAAFNAWKTWAKKNKFKQVMQEVRIVSEQHLFGGTFDLCEVNKLRTISDYKTSKRIYLDHVVQIAAYGLLWRESYPCKTCWNGVNSVGFIHQQETLGNKKVDTYPTCPKCKGSECSKPIHRYQLIHLDKNTGQPDVMVIPAEIIKPAEDTFLTMRTLYQQILTADKLYGLNRRDRPDLTENLEATISSLNEAATSSLNRLEDRYSKLSKIVL
jgi:hypothetical protein